MTTDKIDRETAKQWTAIGRLQVELAHTNAALMKVEAKLEKVPDEVMEKMEKLLRTSDRGLINSQSRKAFLFVLGLLLAIFAKVMYDGFPWDNPQQATNGATSHASEHSRPKEEHN